MAKYYKCPFCDRKYVEENALYDHIDSKHHDDCCGLPPAQIYFNFTNKYALTKANGRSVISGKPTAWNPVTNRYERFLPSEKEQYRQMFIDRMKRAGKENIMNDMKHQKEMLANRKISGTYIWSDGTKFTYTGSYEKKFLEYLDSLLQFPSSDICAPAPQIFTYTFEGVGHSHIPDFYITSLNLIVNIKSAANQGYRLRDLEREKAEDHAIEKTGYNYIKLYDNEFSKFLPAVERIRQNMNSNNDTKVIIESCEIVEDEGTNNLVSILLEDKTA